MDKEKKSLLTQILVLFASSSTLVCCAIPALLVAIGATSALISLFSNIPFLITISENKELVFTISGLLIIIAFWTQRKDEIDSCELDDTLMMSCNNLKKINKIMLYSSLFIYLVGLFFAFFAKYLI